MSTPQEQSHAERLQKLERAVGTLQRRVRDLEAGLAAVHGEQPAVALRAVRRPSGHSPEVALPAPGRPARTAMSGPIPAPAVAAPALIPAAQAGPVGTPPAPLPVPEVALPALVPQAPAVAHAPGAGPRAGTPGRPAPPPARRPGVAAGAAGRARPVAPTRHFDFDMLKRSEFWLNKVGVALLLFGVAFLFKYSADQGWLTPALRVAGGLVLGAILLGLGLRFARNRRRFSQVLLGGSIATFYMTGFATYQLFHLVEYPFVFGFMVAVTILALGLALRQDDPMLSIIGTVGGLATPFLLYTTAGGLVGLVAYSCVILAGTSGLYFLRGWRWLQVTAYVGFWAVLGTGYLGSIWPALAATDFSDFWRGTALAIVPPAGDQWALQAGIAWGWLAFWAVPLLRGLLRAAGPGGKAADVHRFIVAATLIAVGFSRVIWALPNGTFSLVVFAGAALYGAIAWGLRPRNARLAYTQAALALLLFTLGLVLLLQGDALIFSLAAEAAVFHVLASRLGDRGLSYTAHFLFAIVAVGLVPRLAGAPSGALLLVNPQALTDLAVIALALGASRVLRHREVATGYGLAAYFALACWLWRELSYLPYGPSYVMLAWGALAVALLLLAERASDVYTRISAHVMFGLAGLLLAASLATAHDGALPILNLTALLNLAVILLALAVSILWATREEAPFYRVAAYGAVVVWLWRELSYLPQGQSYVMLAWAALAVGLLLFAERTSDVYTRISAHIVFGLAGLLLAASLATAHDGALPVLNPTGLLDLAVIVLALVMSSLFTTWTEVRVYRVAAYGAVVVWLWRELSYLPQGQSYVMIAWAALAAGLLLLAERAGDVYTRVSAHVVFGLAGLLLAINLATGHEAGLAVLNLTGLLDLVVILLALTVSSLWLMREEALVYRLIAYVALLLWTWRELAVLPNGNVYVTIAWAGYAIALLVAAVRLQRNRLLLNGALATLGLAVTKLFLVDLSAVDTIWRILLFLGFGGLFLVLSYYFQNLLRPAPGAGGAAEHSDELEDGDPAAEGGSPPELEPISAVEALPLD